MTQPSLEPKTIRKVSLACGDTVYTEVELRLQYPTDVHYILCPNCEKSKSVYATPEIPTAWQNVTGVEEVDPNDLRDVSEWIDRIMPDRILRLQPSAPSNRIRPFPYVRRIR